LLIIGHQQGSGEGMNLIVAGLGVLVKTEGCRRRKKGYLEFTPLRGEGDRVNGAEGRTRDWE